MKRNFLFSFFVFCFILPLFSQEVLKSTEEEYYDFLSLQGLVERPTLNYRTLSDSEWIINDEAAEDHPWKNNNLGKKYTLWESSNPVNNWFTKGINQNIKLKIYGPEWFNSYNTTAPYGQNDGALWQGRGYNTSLTSGARLEAFGFEITVKPVIGFSQNGEFETYTVDSQGNTVSDGFGYFQPGVDLVQRYGTNPFYFFDYGDSEIRWSWYNFTIGFGTQNPWLGPAWLNPMLGSNNAASYPKIDIGLRRTKIIVPVAGTYLGDIEGRIWAGCIEESEYFTDVNNPSKKNLLTGISLAYSPSFIPGFSCGVNRIFLSRWKPENIQYIGRLFTLAHKNDIFGDGEDQKCSLFVDWTFSKIGFEVYGELGLDDFSSDEISNPFHTAIYTVGCKQNIPIDKINKSLRSEILCEFNNFEMSQDFQLQWTYQGYYSHGKIQQGYTNKGQCLGAGSGYFGNSQFIGYKFYYPLGSTMIFFHRECPDINYILNKAVYSSATPGSEFYNLTYARYETHLDFGINTDFFIASNTYMSLCNQFVYIHNVHYNSKDDFNYKLAIDFSYKF